MKEILILDLNCDLYSRIQDLGHSVNIVYSDWLLSVNY